MSADHYFAVPLLVRDVEPAVRDAIRAKVAAYLKSEGARRDIAPSPEESVATSYYHPDASILEDAGLDELEALVLRSAKSFLEQTLKLPPRRIEVERAWINIFEPGAQEAQHSHDGSLLSCSYYVEAPENCGCIVFPDPIGARRSYRQFTKTAGPDLLTRQDIAVAPEPGRLVMFESWFPHAVQCNKSDKPRVSIAINLREAQGPASAVPGWAAENVREADIPGAHVAAPGTVQDLATSEARAAAPENRDASNASREPAHSAGTPATSAGKPFLFNELFEVRKNIGLDLNAVQDTIPTVAIDNLLEHPERVREVIGSTPATNWKHEPGGRNFVDYYDCRLRFPIRHPNSLVSVAQQAIAKVYGINTRPADASVDVNWFMQINARRADFAVPHSDITERVRRSFTCILYLNTPEECSGGTAFFRFKPSNSLTLDEGYARAVKEDSRVAETGLDYWPEASREHWELVGTVDMVPGRLLIFPSEYFHSAHHPVDSFYAFPRLTLAFWMVT